MYADFESLIQDFAGSQNYLFLDAKVKEHADGLLGAFAAACTRRGVASPDLFTYASLDAILLGDMPRLNAPLDVRRAVPGLLAEFFDYLAASGHYPAAAEWSVWIAEIGKKYQALFRDDGSVKGETFKKKYTDVNRNDPCPCGSGKKFKKCCMDLIS
jgi:hypothetical protein